MYEDLVKRLRNCAIEAAPCKTCNMAEDGSCTDTLMKQAADAIEELIAERDAYCKAMTEEHNKAARLTWEYRWIPVTERLPEDRVPVLTTYIGFCTGEKSSDLLAVRFEGMWCYWDGDPCSYDECKVEITHWMPLPQPPKEES